MKKTAFFASLLMLLMTLSTSIIKAQVSIGIQGGVGLPMGDFGKEIDMTATNGGNGGGAKTGYGFELNARYLISDHVAAGITIGYHGFTGPEFNESTFFFPITVTSKYSIIPITLSGEYYFMTEKLKPFIGLDLGYYMVNIEATATMLGQTETSNENYNGLGLAPHIGVAYAITDGLDILLNAKYNMVFNKDKDVGFPNTTWLGVNLGLAYNIR